MLNWQAIVIEPAKTVIMQISQFLINMLLVLAILLVGWLVSKLVRSILSRLLKTLRFDTIGKKIEIDKLLSKGGIKQSPSDLIGIVVYWIILLITFVVAVNAIGLTIAGDLLNRIVLYIPNIVAAIFILIIGMFVATLLRNIVKTAAINTGLIHAQLLSKIVEAVVIVFAVMITLEQLNIGARIVEMIVSIVLASFGLAFALAFGFGCQDTAKKFLNDIIEKFNSKK